MEKKCGKELTQDERGITMSMKNHREIKHNMNNGISPNQGKIAGAFKKAKTNHVVSLMIF